MLWWGPFFLSARAVWILFCFRSLETRRRALFLPDRFFSVVFLLSSKILQMDENPRKHSLLFCIFKKALDLWLSTISELLFFFKIHLGQDR
jgi:hypothetical protein